MEIYIVRHGIAEDATRGISDAKRALTAEGRKKMKEAAAGFAQLEPDIERIFSSPLVRAWQTADIFASALDREVEGMDELAPGVAPRSVLNKLQEMHDAKSVMLVGHQPNCSELASHLLSNSGTIDIEFKKGAICVIQMESMSAGSGILLCHFTPAALRLMKK